MLGLADHGTRNLPEPRVLRILMRRFQEADRTEQMDLSRTGRALRVHPILRLNTTSPRLPPQMKITLISNQSLSSRCHRVGPIHTLFPPRISQRHHPRVSRPAPQMSPICLSSDLRVLRSLGPVALRGIHRLALPSSRR